MSVVTVDKQIDNYLSLLTTTQKKAILTVVKTIALASQEYDNLWDDPHFSEEMDRRTAEYESGEAKLCQFEEMKNAAVTAYKEKKKRKK
jgi:hypothetical protein